MIGDYVARKLQKDGENCRGGEGKNCNTWGEESVPQKYCTTLGPGMIKREFRYMKVFRVEKK